MSYTVCFAEQILRIECMSNLTLLSISDRWWYEKLWN